ncbi:glycosyltransferase family 2 protein [Salinispora arenicola]|uniref:GT2 family glycosyltransferase n=1 Tax=Salinispora arenicola TaxID=168697 RepID=A0A542XUW1_SALAC|nr:glycosyltransferase family 2 protein [Salinispora arenicola]MCN0154028.1 glycosyltransferase family 2 protein [Salinispora arenicola]TQL39483.1 GT2 family glycosyltransferase [Salinispora arenicola]GIM86530.1 rhamnosyltransferase [Salinispora arenicola]
MRTDAVDSTRRSSPDGVSVAALVVTHNRRHQLRACLSALGAQTRPIDEILVYDNSSTDGSVRMVRRDFPAVTVESGPRNTGGAGGFSRGLDMLIRRGHTFAWLLDDDALPCSDALAPLLRAMTSTGGTAPGFVASTVLSHAGDPIDSHVPARITAEENQGLPTPPDTYPAAYATFVGVLVNLAVARRTYLPIADFFIWWDDYEYTARLQSIAGGLASTASVVLHPDKPEWLSDLGPRLRYAVRNRLWIIRGRRRGLASPHARQRAASGLWTDVRSYARCARRKDQLVWWLGRALAEGLLTRPRLVRPDTRRTNTATAGRGSG